MAVFSNCCFGGRRKKWTALLTNCQEVFEALHRPDCPHDGGESYAPYYGREGQIIYPTEEEAEYPPGLVEAYSEGLKRGLERLGYVFSLDEQSRLDAVKSDLQKYHTTDEKVLEAVSSKVVAWERTMVPGEEKNHLMALLRQGHYRGTDVRVTLEHNGERRMVPYPALRWVWREVLSYRWKHDGDHINVLEAQALFTHALLDYFVWLEQEAMPVPKTTRKLDDSLAEYLEHLFLDDRPIAYAGHTLSALKRFHPRIRWKIPLAKQYFSNWKQIYVTRQAVPMPVEVLMAVAGVAASCKEWGPYAGWNAIGAATMKRKKERTSTKAEWSLQSYHISCRCPPPGPAERHSNHRTLRKGGRKGLSAMHEKMAAMSVRQVAPCMVKDKDIPALWSLAVRRCCA
eukprot:symbB.v1.2.032787.t1/scaffold3970.1/size47191/2